MKSIKQNNQATQQNAPRELSIDEIGGVSGGLSIADFFGVVFIYRNGKFVGEYDYDEGVCRAVN